MAEKGYFACKQNHMVIRNEVSANIVNMELRRQRLSVVLLFAVK
jgi:hypothetical protein